MGTLERDGGTHRYVEETKSKAGGRRVPVPFLVEELAAHLARAPESGFLFPSRSGAHLHYWNFLKRPWHPTVARAGLAPLDFHELRQTAAAFMRRGRGAVRACPRRVPRMRAGSSSSCGNRL